jgi:hypothetical protein
MGHTVPKGNVDVNEGTGELLWATLKHPHIPTIQKIGGFTDSHRATNSQETC